MREIYSKASNEIDLNPQDISHKSNILHFDSQKKLNGIVYKRNNR